jgi:uncharacterized protein YecE (DUF72 family)
MMVYGFCVKAPTTVTQGGRRRHIRMQHIEATLEQAQAADDLIRLLA